jgi:hypothetical protein
VCVYFYYYWFLFISCIWLCDKQTGMRTYDDYAANADRFDAVHRNNICRYRTYYGKGTQHFW